MSETLSRREDQSIQSTKDGLAKIVAAETGHETHAHSRLQRESLGSLAIQQAEVEKMLASGSVNLKSLFDLFRSAARKLPIQSRARYDAPALRCRSLTYHINGKAKICCEI